MDERVRKAAGSQAATGLLQRRPEPPKLRDLIGRQAPDRLGVIEKRIHLGLEDVEPPIETTGGEQLHGDLRRPPLEPGIPAKQLLVHLERRLPADEVVELRQEPAPLPLDGQQCQHIAGESCGERDAP